MLAQNFKSADELRITKPQLSALQKTLVFLETGRLVHSGISDGVGGRVDRFTGHFNMHTWNTEHACGTVACIGGTAELVGNVSFDLSELYNTNHAIHDLFEPTAVRWTEWQHITPTQAATALRSYLTTGSANWEDAVR